MAIRSFALALASQFLGLGAEFLDPSDKGWGQVLTAISLAAYAFAALIFLWEWLTGRFRQPKTSAHALPPLTPTARDLTNQERLLMQSTILTMLGSEQHDHEPDTVTLASDILYGRPIDGPCGICGEPRLGNKLTKTNEEGDQDKNDYTNVLASV